MLRFARMTFLCRLLLPVLLCCCAGTRHFHPIPTEGPQPAPRYVELKSEASAATMHFPAGLYSLFAEDNAGYYYRAPRKIAEHTSGAHIWHEGGIYVNKRNPRKLRGYVYWGGALTHLGNLSRIKHEFRD